VITRDDPSGHGSASREFAILTGSFSEYYFIVAITYTIPRENEGKKEKQEREENNILIRAKGSAR
jgi:hypothetical protein